MKNNNVSSGIYGMAFLGAAVYYVQHAPTFLLALFGIVKAAFWPALIMLKM